MSDPHLNSSAFIFDRFEELFDAVYRLDCRKQPEETMSKYERMCIAVELQRNEIMQRGNKIIDNKIKADNR